MNSTTLQEQLLNKKEIGGITNNMEYAKTNPTPLAATALGLAIPGALSFLDNFMNRRNGGTNPIDLNVNTPEIEIARRFHNVNHHELGYVQTIAEKDSKITELNAKLYTNEKVDQLENKVYFEINQLKERCNNLEKGQIENTHAINRVFEYGKCHYVEYKKVLNAKELCPQPLFPETTI